jgi:hypothetical protein
MVFVLACWGPQKTICTQAPSDVLFTTSVTIQNQNSKKTCLGLRTTAPTLTWGDNLLAHLFFHHQKSAQQKLSAIIQIKNLLIQDKSVIFLWPLLK